MDDQHDDSTKVQNSSKDGQSNHINSESVSDSEVFNQENLKTISSKIMISN
jgi:hypothetical protein